MEWNVYYLFCSLLSQRQSRPIQKTRNRSAAQSILSLTPRCPRGSRVPYKSEEHQFCVALLTERTVRGMADFRKSVLLLLLPSPHWPLPFPSSSTGLQTQHYPPPHIEKEVVQCVTLSSSQWHISDVTPIWSHQKNLGHEKKTCVPRRSPSRPFERRKKLRNGATIVVLQRFLNINMV